jgi:hypothetical protein
VEPKFVGRSHLVLAIVMSCIHRAKGPLVFNVPSSQPREPSSSCDSK